MTDGQQANKFYITTPIYYVNAKPHIGHAYSTIVADVLARFWRDRLDHVHFLTGTDEHGQKIQRAADDKGISPQEFTDQISPKFKELWEVLNVQHDDYIRTTEDRHKKAVEKVLTQIHDAGEIYEGSYSGWYCVPCETFYNEEELQDEKCPECHRDVQYLEEKNYFFKLSAYQDWLIQYIKDNPKWIFPETRRNEVLGFLENNKLQDLCISRPKERLTWGIPIPFDQDHVTYVWFDALTNYISAIGYGVDDEKFNALWSCDVHMMAKDIIRHHAVYWPIMLKALGLPLPKHIVAHGWWKMDDTKMSKSLGNVVDPVAMTEKYGVDAVRYFLMRDVNFGSDGNFSIEAFEKRFNSDLANDLGNLLSRTSSMFVKYLDGKVPQVDQIKFPDNIDMEFFENFVNGELEDTQTQDFSEFNFTKILEDTWAVIGAANKFIEDVKPWELRKEEKTEELNHFLLILLKVLRFAGERIKPFMPETSQKILDHISGEVIEKSEPLFPRLENKK